MPEARRELLDAATSHASSGENRLTEVLAAVLATHDEFASALMRKVGLPVGERFEVVTQQRVAPGCIVDMVLRSSRSGGAPVSQLWSEHKTISGFRHEQREDYARALGARPGEGRLLTITPAHTDQAQGSWARMTWQGLAELADGVGQQWGKDGWRESALAPTAPARERLLHELLWYLEMEGFAMLRPIIADDVHVFGRMIDSWTALNALMERASEHIGGLVEDSFDIAPDGDWWSFHITPPPDAWLERLAPHETYCEVLLADEGRWWPLGAGEPAVGAGYTLAKELHERLGSRSDWVDRLEENDYTLVVADGYVRCWQTRPLADFLDAGETLDDQARELARWARQSIEALSRLDPGDIGLSDAREQSTRRAQKG
jgi:hypothetical protein